MEVMKVNGNGRQVVNAEKVKAGLGGRRKKKDIEELQKMEPVWQRSCVDCGWTGSLSCGSEMGPDRVISHVEIYPGFFQKCEDETE